MALIKTVKELVREKMSEITEELPSFFAGAIRPIYGAKVLGKPGEPYHIGSSILVSINGEKYLITAAHVMSHAKKTTLYVCGESELVQIEGNCVITKNIDNRSYDKFDFAFMKLSDSQIEKLGKVEYLSDDDFFMSEPSGKLCVAVGYRNSMNKKFKGNKVSKNLFAYGGTLKNNRKYLDKLGITNESHFLISYEKYGIKPNSTDRIRSEAPFGISGGGLFYITNFTVDIYKPETKFIGKLAGVVIQFDKDLHLLISVRLSTIISEIKKFGTS